MAVIGSSIQGQEFGAECLALRPVCCRGCGSRAWGLGFKLKVGGLFVFWGSGLSSGVRMSAQRYRS